MKWYTGLVRQVRLAAKRDLLLGAVSLAAKTYAVVYTVEVSLNKTLGLPLPERRAWLIAYVVCVLAIPVLQFVPKARRAKWVAVERTRTEATNVAISELASCVRSSACTEVEFRDITRRLLTAMRQEIEQFVADTESIYINVSLMVQDEIKPGYLRVLNRANDNRPLSVYPKGDLGVWVAMQNFRAEYIAKYNNLAKEYRCILALPIIVEDEVGVQTSIGVVSIDSGRPGEFDGQVEDVNLRMLPYLSLLKLSLDVRQQYGDGNGDKRPRE